MIPKTPSQKKCQNLKKQTNINMKYLPKSEWQGIFYFWEHNNKTSKKLDRPVFFQIFTSHSGMGKRGSGIFVLFVVVVCCSAVFFLLFYSDFFFLKIHSLRPRLQCFFNLTFWGNKTLGISQDHNHIFDHRTCPIWTASAFINFTVNALKKRLHLN